MHDENLWIPTRQSLLSRLKDWSDQESWKVFFDTYWKLIYKAAIRAGLNDAEAQDVVQETVITVMKSMESFHYDRDKGSFRGWLMQVTGWRIGDRLRERDRDQKVRVPLRHAAAEFLIDPSQALEATWAEEWEQNLVEAAGERVKRLVNPKIYQIYDLCFFKKWPVSQVATTLNVSTTRVHYANHRVNRLIKKEITRLKDKLF